MPILDTLTLNGCNFQIAYDIIEQSTTNNSTTLSIYGILNVTNNYVSWSSAEAWTYNARSQLATYYSRGSYNVTQGNFTFTHNQDGNLTLALGYGISSTFTSGSAVAYLQLPQIKRFAQIIDTPSSLTDEDDPYITFTNIANATNLNAWLEVNPVGTHFAERTIDITSGTYTWELTSQERLQLASAMPNSNKGKIRLGLYSTQSGTIGASYRDIDFNIVNANPTVSITSITEANPLIVNNNLVSPGVIINNFSNLRILIEANDKAIAKKGASIIKYKFIMKDNYLEIPYSETEDVEGILYKVSYVREMQLQAIDSRGNVGTEKVVNPNPPIIYGGLYFNKESCTLKRDSGQIGENAILTLDGYIWNGNFGRKHNEIRTATYRFKKTNSETWITGTTNITPTLDGNSFSFNGAIASDNANGKWDLDSNYNVEITIGDYLTAQTISFILNSAKPTLSLDDNGVGIMCAYDETIGGKLQVDGKIIDGGTLLWTNLSPTSSFGAQTINLDESLNNYNMYEILFRQSTSTERYFSTGKLPVGYGTILNSFGGRYRPTGATISGSTIDFEDNKTNGSTVNSETIPVYVIGYKSNLFS